MKVLIRNQLLYWFPVYVWAALIFYFSSVPLVGSGISNIEESLFIVSDYYKHIVVYGFLTFLLWRAFYNSKFKHSEIFAIAVSVFYGLSNEAHQYFVPGRIFSLVDILFDFIGCILIQPLIMLYKSFIKK